MDIENALKALRMTYEGDDAVKVYEAFRSHAAISRKNHLMLTFLDDIRQANAAVRLDRHSFGASSTFRAAIRDALNVP